MASDIVPSLPDLAAKINVEHQHALAVAKTALEHATRCGQLLIAAKNQLAHGQWLPWLAEHCPDVSERTAQSYMRIARHWTELGNPQRAADLSVRQALELLSYTAERNQFGDAEAAEEEAASKPPLDERLRELDRVERRREKARRAAPHIRAWKERQEQQFREIVESEMGSYTAPPAWSNQWNLSGLMDQELADLTEELGRSMQWFIGLADRLKMDYEYALPRQALSVARQIGMLRERLTYDREQLEYAVYGLRDLLRDGAKSWQEIDAWRKKGRISDGLLALARNILDIRKETREGLVWWSLGRQTPPPGARKEPSP